MNFSEKYHFNSRETYLAAKKEWSKDYSAAVLRVRQAKLGLKAAQRVFCPLCPYPYRGTSIDKQAWRDAGELVVKAYYELDNSREAMIKLLDDRWKMIAEAGRQVNARRLADKVS